MWFNRFVCYSFVFQFSVLCFNINSFYIEDNLKYIGSIQQTVIDEIKKNKSFGGFPKALKFGGFPKVLNSSHKITLSSSQS